MCDQVHGVGHQRAHPHDLVWLLQPGPSSLGGLAPADRDQRLCDFLLGGAGHQLGPSEVDAPRTQRRDVRVGVWEGHWVGGRVGRRTCCLSLGDWSRVLWLRKEEQTRANQSRWLLSRIFDGGINLCMSL